MEEQETKKGLCTLKLVNLDKSMNSKDNDDFTIKHATFSILDFGTSGNSGCVTKEVCEASMDTLVNKPLLCQYLPSTNGDYENPNDDYGDHGMEEITLRNGEDYVTTNTHAIGTCINSYIGNTIDDEGNNVECLLADFELWFDRYPNEIMLMDDFYESRQPLYSSCEYFYKDYVVKDGVSYPSKVWFSGHTVLGSRTNKVDPAYQSSKLQSFNSQWDKALNSINKLNNSLQSSENLDSNIENQNINEKEVDNSMKDNIFRKALNDISLGDLRCSILNALGDVMTANEFNTTYVSSYSIYPEQQYFIYESYNQDTCGWEAYKVQYSTAENDDIILDFNSKQIFTGIWVEPIQEKEGGEEMEEMNNNAPEKSINELDVANEKIEELTKEVETLNLKLAEKSNNSADKEKLVELQNTVISLNSMVENMKPIVEKYNAEVFEKALNEAKENYKDKFAKVNALDLFEVESTQELIKESINSNREKALEARCSLNELIVNNIKIAEPVVNSDDILATTPKISINQVNPIVEENNELINEKEMALKDLGLDY